MSQIVTVPVDADRDGIGRQRFLGKIVLISV
jgi:hypothetical protein